MKITRITWRLVGSTVYLALAICLCPVCVNAQQTPTFKLQRLSLSQSQEYLNAIDSGASEAPDGTQISHLLRKTQSDYAVLVIKGFIRDIDGKYSLVDDGRTLMFTNYELGGAAGYGLSKSGMVALPIWIGHPPSNARGCRFHVGVRVKFGPDYLKQVLTFPDSIRTREVYELDVVLEDPIRKEKAHQEQVDRLKRIEAQQKDRQDKAKTELQNKIGVSIQFLDTIPADGHVPNYVTIDYADGNGRFFNLFLLWTPDDLMRRFGHLADSDGTVQFNGVATLGGDLVATWVDASGQRCVGFVRDLHSRSVVLPADADYHYKLSSALHVALSCKSAPEHQAIKSLGFYLTEEDKAWVHLVSLEWKQPPYEPNFLKLSEEPNLIPIKEFDHIETELPLGRYQVRALGDTQVDTMGVSLGWITIEDTPDKVYTIDFPDDIDERLTQVIERKKASQATSNQAQIKKAKEDYQKEIRRVE